MNQTLKQTLAPIAAVLLLQTTLAAQAVSQTKTTTPPVSRTAAPLVSSSTSAPAAKTASEDEVVKMDAFTVRPTSENGYLSAEASSGTRYAASIMETPMSVQAITSEFMEDFNAFDLNGQDALTFVAGFSPVDGTGQINLRGVTGSAVYKNGIREPGVFGPAGLDRTEIIRGANAAIYGQTEPSGLVNRITKRARNQASQELRFMYGQSDNSRLMLDVNQPIIPGELLMRVAASQEYSNFGVQDWTGFRRSDLYGTLTWKIGPKTTFTINGEYIWFQSHKQGTSQMPWLYRAIRVVDPNGRTYSTRAQYIGIMGIGDYKSYRHLNTNGPDSYNQVEASQVDATLVHKFSSHLSVQFKGAIWDRVQGRTVPDNISAPTNNGQGGIGTAASITNAYDVGTLNLSTGQEEADVTKNTIVGGGVPSVERNRSSKATAQVDILGDFRTWGISHKILLTADYSNQADYNSKRDTNGAINTSTGQYTGVILPLNNYLIGGPNEIDDFKYDADFHDSQWDGGVMKKNVKGMTITKGLMASDRLGFFQDRVFLLVGGRHDQLNRSLRDNLSPILGTPVGSVYHQPVDTCWTYQTGGIWRITKRTLSFYVNASSSFVPQDNTSATNRDINGRPLPSQQGFGKEAGFKGSIANSKFTYTLGAYELKRTNIPRVVRGADNRAQTSPVTGQNYSDVADVRSRGTELNGQWHPIREIAVTFALSYNDIRYIKVPNMPYSSEMYLLNNGVRPDVGSPYTGSITAGYRFYTGKLKGFSFRVAARYFGRYLISSNNINTAYASIYGNSNVKGVPITVGSKTFDTYFFQTSGYVRLDGFLEYRWDGRISGKKFDNKLTFGVTNMLNENYLVNLRPADPVTFTLSYTLKH